MNSNHLYAFYGSLRNGMSNHLRYKRGLEFIFTETLAGYRLHAMRKYPYAIRTGKQDDAIVVEIYRVRDTDIEVAIHHLELSVGYHYDEETIRGTATGIYLFAESGPEAVIPGGDWVKYWEVIS